MKLASPNLRKNRKNQGAQPRIDPVEKRSSPPIARQKQAQIPEWFIDGKLGIFMHWGPESIPGVASTWYARWMYEEGSEGYKYHCATYGHPSKFGYHFLISTRPKRAAAPGGAASSETLTRSHSLSMMAIFSGLRVASQPDEPVADGSLQNWTS